jgi:DNA-binding MarR family transcriptional regulator
MPHILTLHQYKVLALLSQRSQWTLKDIATVLQVSKSAASKCVKRLEKQGVIQKEMYANNRECMNIHITQGGKEAIKFMSTQKFM